MLLYDRPQDVQSIEILLFPVPSAIILALISVRIKPTALFKGILAAVVAVREIASSQGIELVKCDAVLAETGKELRLYRSVEGIVHALICDRFDPAVSIAEFADLCDFPGRVVADPEPIEFA